MKTITSPNVSTQTFNFTFRDVHQDFMVSREAIGVSVRTYKWYEYHLGKYYKWLESQGYRSIEDAANGKNINGFLAHLHNRKPLNSNGIEITGRSSLSDRYIHGYARTIKSLLRFSYEEHYIGEPVKFKMPPIRKNKLPVLEIDDITRLLAEVNSSRDLVLITLAIASGLRLSEIVQLNWGEVDLRKGRIDVLSGKGKKFRTVIIDKDTLHLLIRYHHELKAFDEELTNNDSPVLITDEYKRLTSNGIRSIFVRLEKKTGIHFSAHALRRTYAKMAIKNGMDIIWLQTLMGHENLETTRSYIQGLDIEDVEKAYQEHAPLKGMIRVNKFIPLNLSYKGTNKS